MNRGVFPSLSAIVQHSLDALRQKDEAERADTEALKALLQARTQGTFVDVQAFQSRVDRMLDQSTRRYGVED